MKIELSETFIDTVYPIEREQLEPIMNRPVELLAGHPYSGIPEDAVAIDCFASMPNIYRELGKLPKRELYYNIRGFPRGAFIDSDGHITAFDLIVRAFSPEGMTERLGKLAARHAAERLFGKKIDQLSPRPDALVISRLVGVHFVDINAEIDAGIHSLLG